MFGGGAEVFVCVRVGDVCVCVCEGRVCVCGCVCGGSGFCLHYRRFIKAHGSVNLTPD